MYGKLTPRSFEWNDTIGLRISPQVKVGVFVDLIEQAYESACGYWIDEDFKATDLKRRVFEGSSLDDFKHLTSFTLVDCEGVVKAVGDRYTVDAECVKRGVELILRNGAGVRSDLVAQVASIVTGDPDIDDEACDVIIQLGLFGEVIFG
jgi:hypothetical protein